METMNYYTNSNIGLEEIEELAVGVGYTIKTYSSREVLYIYFGDDHFMRWEWSVYTLNNLSIEDDARTRLKELNPNIILLFEYYPKWLPEIVKFMKIVLKKYGGWLDCLGNVDQMYNLENVEGIISGCP
jgi:hypothetical protein